MLLLFDRFVCVDCQIRYFVSPINSTHLSKSVDESIEVQWHQDNFMQIVVCLHVGEGASKVFRTHPRTGSRDTFWVDQSSIDEHRVSEWSLQAGDVLFLPANYPHSVCSVGETVTLNWGFCTGICVHQRVRNNCKECDYNNEMQNALYSHHRERSSSEIYVLPI